MQATRNFILALCVPVFLKRKISIGYGLTDNLTDEVSSLVQGIVLKTLVVRHRLVSRLHSENLNTITPGGNFINLC